MAGPRWHFGGRLANRATATSVATLQAQATVRGYQVVFAYAAGFLVAGAVIAGLLLRRGAVASLEITGLRVPDPDIERQRLEHELAEEELVPAGNSVRE
jgi:hypothetical protein